MGATERVDEKRLKIGTCVRKETRTQSRRARPPQDKAGTVKRAQPINEDVESRRGGMSCPNMIRPCTRTHPVRVPGTRYRIRYRHVHMSWYMVLNPVPLCTQVMVHGSQAQVYLSGERSQMLPNNIYVGSRAARSWAQIINSDNSQPTQLHTSSLQASRG